MGLAIDEAAPRLAHGDVPIGAVVLRDGEVIAARHNERELDRRPDGPRRGAGPARRRRGASGTGASTTARWS